MQRREVENVAFFKGKKVLPDHLQLAGRHQMIPKKSFGRLAKKLSKNFKRSTTRERANNSKKSNREDDRAIKIPEPTKNGLNHTDITASCAADSSVMHEQPLSINIPLTNIPPDAHNYIVIE